VVPETIRNALSAPWAIGGITGIVGYVGGIFTEPLKKRLVNRDERRRLRNALYSELGLNIANTILNRPRKERLVNLPIGDWLRTEVYDQALRSSPVLLHEIKETPIFAQYYLAMSAAKAASPDDQRTILDMLGNFIRGRVEAKKLSRRKLNAVCPLEISLYPHPVIDWLTKRLRRLHSAIVWRNVPKDGKTRGFLPTVGTSNKIRALWCGVPGEEFPISPAAPNDKTMD